MRPHTSNWDFPIGLLTEVGVTSTLQRDAPASLAKRACSKLAVGYSSAALYSRVNRKVSTGFVEQMAARFTAEPRMCFRDRARRYAQLCAAYAEYFYYVASSRRGCPLRWRLRLSRQRVVADTFLTPTGGGFTDRNTRLMASRQLGNRGCTCRRRQRRGNSAQTMAAGVTSRKRSSFARRLTFAWSAGTRRLPRVESLRRTVRIRNR